MARTNHRQLFTEQYRQDDAAFEVLSAIRRGRWYDAGDAQGRLSAVRRRADAPKFHNADVDRINAMEPHDSRRREDV